MYWCCHMSYCTVQMNIIIISLESRKSEPYTSAYGVLLCYVVLGSTLAEQDLILCQYRSNLLNVKCLAPCRHHRLALSFSACTVDTSIITASSCNIKSSQAHRAIHEHSYLFHGSFLFIYLFYLFIYFSTWGVDKINCT